jgi:hypothetical protein
MPYSLRDCWVCVWVLPVIKSTNLEAPSEYLKLNEQQVRFVMSLNEVHLTQRFEPWKLKGQPDYYLLKRYLTSDIPADFKELFETFEKVDIKNAQIEHMDLSSVYSYEDSGLRAAFDPYNPKELPKNIYHYTDADALKSIVENKELWATHYSFLNDFQEFEYAKKLFKEMLPIRLNGHPKFQILLDHLNLFEKQFKYYNAFLTSFSTNGDLLSQWRGYANSGKGYSLGFKTSIIGLSSPVNKRKSKYLIRPVLYDLKRQKEKIIEVIDNTIQFIDSSKEEMKTDDKYCETFYKNLHWNGLLCIVSFKSESFKEESEWRIIVVQDVFDSLRPENLKLHFRSNGENIIPFVKIDINSETGDLGSKFPLREIYYGPKLHKELTEKSLELFTSSHLATRPTFKQSSLTLR